MRRGGEIGGAPTLASRDAGHCHHRCYPALTDRIRLLHPKPWRTWPSRRAGNGTSGPPMLPAALAATFSDDQAKLVCMAPVS